MTIVAKTVFEIFIESGLTSDLELIGKPLPMVFAAQAF